SSIPSRGTASPRGRGTTKGLATITRRRCYDGCALDDSAYTSRGCPGPRAACHLARYDEAAPRSRHAGGDHRGEHRELCPSGAPGATPHRPRGLSGDLYAGRRAGGAGARDRLVAVASRHGERPALRLTRGRAHVPQSAVERRVPPAPPPPRTGGGALDRVRRSGRPSRDAGARSRQTPAGGTSLAGGHVPGPLLRPADRRTVAP